MIPKIIWQTHEWEYDRLPQNFKRCAQTWKNLNPEWEYKYHSAIDRAIEVRNFDKELYEYYMFADKVTQSDIWRYVVIYQYGGFYTDMDSFCTIPLEYSFQKYYDGKEVFCTKTFFHDIQVENTSNVISVEHIHNSPIAAVQKSWVVRMIIENVKNKYRKYKVLDLYNKIESESKSLARRVANELWLGTVAFGEIIFNNRDRVCFDYSGDLHSEALKKDFKSDFMVDYYGEEVSYITLCRDKGWEDPI